MLEDIRNDIQSKYQERSNHLISFFKKNDEQTLLNKIQKSLDEEEVFLELNEEEFDDMIEKGEFIEIPTEGLTKFISDFKNNLTLNKVTEEEIEKAKKDLSKLHKVSKTFTRNGKSITSNVWIADKEDKNETANGKALKLFEKLKRFGGVGEDNKSALSKLGLQHSELSHINKIRFEREYEKHHGKKFDKETKYGEVKDLTKEKEANKFTNSSDFELIKEARKLKNAEPDHVNQLYDEIKKRGSPTFKKRSIKQIETKDSDFKEKNKSQSNKSTKSLQELKLDRDLILKDIEKIRKDGTSSQLQEIKTKLNNIDKQIEEKRIQVRQSNSINKGGEGSKGGKIIGHTRSGKPIYAKKSIASYEGEDFSAKDHFDAYKLHKKEAKNYSEGHMNYDWHNVVASKHAKQSGFGIVNKTK